MTPRNVVALVQDSLRAQKAKSAVTNMPTCFVTYLPTYFQTLIERYYCYKLLLLLKASGHICSNPWMNPFQHVYLLRVNTTVERASRLEILLHPLFQRRWNVVCSEDIFQISCFRLVDGAPGVHLLNDRSYVTEHQGVHQRYITNTTWTPQERIFIVYISIHITEYCNRYE